MAVLSFADLSDAIISRTPGYRTDYRDTWKGLQSLEQDICRTLMLEAAETSGTNLALDGTLTVEGNVTINSDVAVNGEFSATHIFGSHEKTVTEITGDGAVAVTASGVTKLSKGSAAAITVAAPSSEGIEITIMSNSDFAHVVTFTGSTLWDGTTGASVTATFAAFKGASITVISSATKWYVKCNNLTTIA